MAVEHNITDKKLNALDLLQFNNGQNPYSGNSVNNGFVNSTEYYRSMLRHFGIVDKTVLDLMCGFGTWSIFLAESNQSVIAMDRNKGVINIAKGLSEYFKQRNIKYLVGDVSDTRQFPNEYFDAVWL